MSRRQDYLEQLTRQRDQAHEEATEARETAAVLRGRLVGEQHAAQTIAVQLAQHAAAVGGQLTAVRMGGQRAVADALTFRHLVAEHVDALRAGLDPEIAATMLVDQLMVRGISIQAELHRVETERAQRQAQVSASEAAAAVAVPAEAR